MNVEENDNSDRHTECSPFCSKISADGNNRDKRRKPNPLRLAGRVFNFQDHQYVPRNPSPRVLQSLWLPRSPSLSLPIHRLFFSPRETPRGSATFSLSISSFLASSLFRSDRSVDGAPRTEGDAAYIYHFTRPRRLHGYIVGTNER